MRRTRKRSRRRRRRRKSRRRFYHKLPPTTRQVSRISCIIFYGVVPVCLQFEKVFLLKN